MGGVFILELDANSGSSRMSRDAKVRMIDK